MIQRTEYIHLKYTSIFLYREFTQEITVQTVYTYIQLYEATDINL